MAAAADQALVGAVTKKLSKDIDALSDKLKTEARMSVAQINFISPSQHGSIAV